MKDDLLKNNSRKLTQGQMGRREFIVSAMAAGLTLPSALSLVKKAEAATPKKGGKLILGCLLYTSPSPRDVEESRMPSSA